MHVARAKSMEAQPQWATWTCDRIKHGGHDAAAAALAFELPLRIRTFLPHNIPGGLRDLVEVGRYVFRFICTVRSSLFRRGAARFSQQRAPHVCAEWLTFSIRSEACRAIQTMVLAKQLSKNSVVGRQTRGRSVAPRCL